MENVVHTAQEAKFNAAMLSVYRLDEALIKCNEYSYSADVCNDPKEKAQYLIQWKAELEVFAREISCKLKDCEDIAKNELKEVENMRIAKLPFLLIFRPTEDYGTESLMKVKTFKTWKESLHAFELKLRSYANKYKLLIPDKEDSRHAASH